MLVYNYTMDETTARLLRKDALLIKQIQNCLKAEGINVTQSDIIHEMLCFLAKHQEEFIRELERIEEERKKHEKVFEQWMRFIFKKMQQL